MKDFLDNTFEEGVEITSKADIEDKPGIVVFMGNQTYGIHTEIWTGDNFHQGFMRNDFAALTRPLVWFWSARPCRPDRHLRAAARALATRGLRCLRGAAARRP